MRLLTEAMTWQLAQRVVRTYDLDVPELDNAESTVVGWLLDLAGELAEHLVEPDELRRWTADLRAAVLARPRRSAHRPRRRRRAVRGGPPAAGPGRVPGGAAAAGRALPAGEARPRAPSTSATRWRIAARVADAFAGGRPGRADPVRGGAAGRVPGHRARPADPAARAVRRRPPGDRGRRPGQAIYGWRGASEAALRRFAEHFRTADGEPAPVLPLSVSFRNDELVLDVANDLSAAAAGARASTSAC